MITAIGEKRKALLRAKRCKLAAAAVEMAVVMPILLTMMLGIIEYGWIFTVRQSLANAAREGARTAVLPGTTNQQIQDRVMQYLNPLGLSSATVDMTRATTDNPIETVHVFIPYNNVTLVGSFFGSHDYNLGHTVSMRKEGLD